MAAKALVWREIFARVTSLRLLRDASVMRSGRFRPEGRTIVACFYTPDYAHWMAEQAVAVPAGKVL